MSKEKLKELIDKAPAFIFSQVFDIDRRNRRSKKKTLKKQVDTINSLVEASGYELQIVKKEAKELTDNQKRFRDKLESRSSYYFENDSLKTKK